MRPFQVLAVDVGTSSIKAGLIDQTGRLLAYVHQPLLLEGRSFDDWDPRWWEISLAQALRTLGGGRLLACDALAMSGNGPTLVALDERDQVVGSTLLWMAAAERRPGERSLFLPKVRRRQAEQPDWHRQTRRYLSCPEYLCWRLGAEALTICPEGDFRLAYWDDAALAGSGLAADLFPPFVAPGERMGRTSQAAGAYGLPAGIPIYAGGSDFLMSLAGTACLEEGMVCDRAGSSEGLNLCSRTALDLPGIRVLPHLRPGYWNNAAILGTTGLMFEWFRQLTGQTQRPYGEMMQAIAALDDFADQPFFFPRLDADGGRDFARSVFLNLTPRHGAVHLARAVVESIGFSVRRSLEVLAGGGIGIKALRVSGGQARNREWNQMKADILGLPVEVPAIRDAELAGNAAAALVGAGQFASLTEAAGRLVRLEASIEPDPARHAGFDRRYQDYRAMEARTGCLF